jgi:hypothetical protein
VFKKERTTPVFGYYLVSLVCVGFAVCSAVKISDPGSILEWTLSFVFTLYIASFVVDLYPAVKTRKNNNFNNQTEEHGELNVRY